MTANAYVVGIVGLSASGKTSLLRDLCARLPIGSLAVVSQDNYYRPLAEQARDAQGQPNFDLPSALQRERLADDLRALRTGQRVTQREYTFNVEAASARTVAIEPAPVLVTEGLFVFHYEEVRRLLDLRVFLHADEEICLRRRLERDVRERGYDRATILHQWHHHVLPAYREFVLPYRADADLVIDNDEGLEALARLLRTKLLTAAEINASFGLRGH